MAFCGAALLNKQSFHVLLSIFLLRETVWESLTHFGVMIRVQEKSQAESSQARFPRRWENEAANSSLWTEGQLIIVDGGHITWNIYICIWLYMGLFVSIKFILQLYYLYIGFNPMKIHSSFPWTSIQSRMDLMVKSHSIKSLIRCGHPLIPAGYRWFSELSNGCVRKWDPKIVILYGKEVGVSYFHTMWGPPVMLVGL